MKAYKVSPEGVSFNCVTKFFIKRLYAEIWIIGNKVLCVKGNAKCPAVFDEKKESIEVIEKECTTISDFIQSIDKIVYVLYEFDDFEELEKYAKETVMEWIREDNFSMLGEF